MNQRKNYLTATEVSERWEGAVSVQTMANWRFRKVGPPFQKFGAKVRYPLASLEKWERDHLHNFVVANDNTEPVANNAAA